MNFFLVVIRHSLDDLPLLATADEAEAMHFAENATEESGTEAAAVLNLDSSTPVNLSIWVFVGGKLTESRLVKEF